MLYLSQLLGKRVVDSDGVEIGRLSDLAIQTGEVFPRVTSLAFLGPSRTPFMVSWRKYVAEPDDASDIDRITLNCSSVDIRFSYLQPDELLLSRDLLNKQIVDTQGMKVVRVNDLKLSPSGAQLRLLGAEVGARGLLRAINPWLEKAAQKITALFRRPLEEHIIAWNYMELVDRDLSTVKLAMTHKRLSELHPADVADILEQLDPQQRTAVFDHLDKQQAAETFSELEDEYQTDMIDDLSEHDAAGLLAQMEPDDAADILGDLPYDKAEKLLWLMGVSDERRIRSLLGYKDKSAGGIMTPEFVALPETVTVSAAIEHIRALDEDHGSVHYVYTLDASGQLIGAFSLRDLVLAEPETQIGDIAERDLITVTPELDQEEVAELISKYDLLAIPVVDESKKPLGIVTVDDAMDVMEEEHSEDLAIVGAGNLNKEGESQGLGSLLLWLLRKELWFIIWAILAILLAMSGSIGLLLPALLFAPLVLLVTGDIVSYAMTDLLEYGSSDKEPSGKQLLLRNLGASILVAVVIGALGAAFFGAIGQLGNGGFLIGTLGLAENVRVYLLLGFLPALLSIFVIVLLSVLVTVIARHRLEKDKPLSVLPATLVMMALGLIFQFGLTSLFTLSPLIDLVSRFALFQ